MSRIAHLDADAFFYSVHLQLDPSLAGKPVIVAGDSARSVVSTASYEARAFGIGSGMSVVRAKMLCPHVVFVKPSFDSYREVSQQVWRIVGDQLGPLEQAGLDEAYADLTDQEYPVSLLRSTIKLVKDYTGIQLSAGLGPNRLIAKVASDAEKPAGFLVLTQEQAQERFAKSHPGIIPGIGPKSQQALAQLGVHTLERLRECPPALLSSRFSERTIGELKHRAHFNGSDKLQTVRQRKSRSAEETFSVDLTDPLEMEEEIRLLAQRVGRDLTRREQAGATIGIKVRMADWTTYTRDQTIDHPTCDSEEIFRVAAELLHASPPEEPVRLLGVRVGGLDRSDGDFDHQLQLFS